MQSTVVSDEQLDHCASTEFIRCNVDLCSANNVKGYPQLNIYNNGDFVETFKGARDVERLTEFIKRHAPTPPLPTPPVPETVLEETNYVANPNPSGSVLVLDESNFQSTIEEGPVFVKFFAPWFVTHSLFDNSL